MSNGDSGLAASLGGTVGSRVARIVADATAVTRQKMAPHQAAVAQKILADFTNHVSDELRGVLGPLWNQIADDPETPDVMKAVAGKLGNERGQAWAWLAGTTTSIGMGAGIGAYFTNLLAPTLGAAIAATPNIRLSPVDAAAANIRGLSWGPDLWEDAGTGGINRDRFRVLQALQSLTLGPAEVMELLNRKLISSDDAAGMFKRSGWLHDHADYFFKLRERIVTTPDVAAMWNRGILTEAEAVHMGALDGSTADNVKRFLELGGEPPPLQELLLAWRRGIITEAQVDRAIKQSPIRFEWIDVVKALQWQPLPASEAADAVNQGHMTREAAHRVAAESGIRPDDFDIIIENAGLPPGVELATEAWNRGLLTEAEFESAFLESRLKNRFVPLYKALRWRTVPQETVRRLYREKIITRDQALRRLADVGFSPEDREALLLSEETGSSDSTKELSKTEILGLYADRAIGADDATAFLSALGYADGEVQWLLTLAEIRRSRKYSDAVVARVRAGYVAHRLDSNDASSIMDSLRIPADQRDELISLWDLERLALTKGLTTAQIQTALRRGLIDQAGALARFTEQGYSDDDAAILVSLTAPAPR